MPNIRVQNFVRHTAQLTVAANIGDLRLIDCPFAGPNKYAVVFKGHIIGMTEGDISELTAIFEAVMLKNEKTLIEILKGI